jgi:hypothetical protein
MPGYKAHIAVGICSCMGLLYVISLITHIFPTFLQFIGCFVCAILGSIFPDIDTTSKAQRLFFIFSSIVLLSSIVVQAWFIFLNFSFVTVIVMFLKHRTITHSVWFLFTLSILLILFSVMVFNGFCIGGVLSALAFAIGAFSHLLLDFGL